jgi:hypothetical protein
MVDAVWKDMPVRHTQAANNNYHIPGRHPSDAAIEFRLAHDDENLYGILTLIHDGQVPFEKGDGARDSYFTIGDSLDLLVQSGPDTTVSFYWIRFGLGGGILDMKNLSAKWNAGGLEHALHSGDETATLEFRIPFNALGVDAPRDGDIWRGNVLATIPDPTDPHGKGHATWAFFWPLPQTTHHFGEFVFSDETVRGPVPAPASVRGRLVDPAGNPVVWNHIDASGGVGVDGRHTPTAADGSFEINGLLPGNARLQTSLPDHEIAALELELKPGMNDLGEIVLEKRTRRPKWKVPSNLAADGDVAWFRSWLTEPPDLLEAPDAESWANPSPFAVIALGETEGLAAAGVVLREMDAPAASVILTKEPEGAAEKELPHVSVQWLTRQLTSPGHANPPEQFRYLWAHLRDKAPELLQAGDIACLAVTVRVPDGAAPGDYEGRIDLLDGGKTVGSLPLSFTVAPFALATPEKEAGVYNYQHIGTKAQNNVQWKSEALLEAEARDLSEHGNTVLVLWNTPMNLDPMNTTSQITALRAAARHGMRTLVTTFNPLASHYWWDPKMMRAFLKQPDLPAKSRAFEKELAAIEADFPGTSIAVTTADEVTLRKPKFEAWRMMDAFYDSLDTGREVYITAHPAHLDQMFAIPDEEKPDIVCWSIGGSIAASIGSGEQLNAWAKRVEAAGYTENWCYNNNPVTSSGVFTRLAPGYWLWASPFRVIVPWTYYVPYGDPFDPFDDRGGSELGFAYPEFKDGQWRMIPTIQWESWRDGVDDLRWTVTLEAALAGTELAGDHPAVTEARELLKSFDAYECNVERMAEGFPPDRFTARRRAMLRSIQKLGYR